MSSVTPFTKNLTSFGTCNTSPRDRDTHPLTWRLNDDGTPVFLDDYRAKDGYVGAKKALTEMTPEEVAAMVKEAGVKGRGGAGFPAGVKWSLTMKGEGIPRGYLLCNADEMEPNTYKDRLLMEQEPHLLIEGMIIAAYANNSFRGFVFLRGEYIHAAANLRYAIEEAREAGLLGKNIMGTGFDFDLFVHTGAGRYICGEETALINSLEGKRANPRAKPPFPGQSGAWGKPTVVNNVETLCGVPSVLAQGVEWFHGLCREGSQDHGTKLMGFTGKVKNPGLWEVPLGITARELLEDYAGGMQDGLELKAWQPGGAGTDMLPADMLDIQMCSNGFGAIGSRMGTALAMAVDSKTSIVSVLRNIEEFMAHESCGWCTPCRDGLPWSVKLLRALEEGKGRPGDVELLEEIVHNAGPGNTFCALAPGAITPLGSGIRYFRNEFEAGIPSVAPSTATESVEAS